MPYLIAFGCVSVLLGILSGIFNLKNRPLLRLIAKMAASLTFLAVGLAATALTERTGLYPILVVTALILGLLGDIFLCLHALTDPKSRQMFDAIGLAFFALGHLFFIGIFFSLAPFYWWLLPIIVVLPVALLIAMRLKVIKGGKMTVPMVVYATMLGLMVISSVNAYLHLKTVSTHVALVAAVFFACSDTFLTFKDYGHRWKDNPVLIQLVLITYYAAQAMFAITIIL